ncbi:MAG TPA: hypothetical protein VID94_03755 [Acidimicrobiales bacterium]
MQLGALNLLRALWLTLPLTVGPAIEDALSPTSTPVRAVAALGVWLGWAAVLLALLVPRIVSLTVLRVAIPALVAVTVAAAARGGVEAVDLVAVTVAALVVVVGFWPTVGADLVDGSSYGPERRLPLRMPPTIATALAPFAVVVLLAGASAGPLLLAAGQWVVGGLALIVGVGLAVLAARSLHALSRRFLVFVPGGVVVHDPMSLVEPILLAKASLAAIGPAPADTDAEDLTMGAGGLIMELRLQQPSDLLRRRPGRAPAEVVSTAAVLVAPTRAAAVLAEARERHLPVR